MQRFDFYEDRLNALQGKQWKRQNFNQPRREMLRIGIEEMQDLFQNWEVIL